MPNENQLFLFVCVDDMKMVGNKDKVGPMWEILRKDIDLEEPTPAESKYVWVAPTGTQKLITQLFKPKQTCSEESPPQE